MDDPEYLCGVLMNAIRVSEVPSCPRYLPRSDSCTKTGITCQVMAQCYDQDVRDIISVACPATPR